MCFGCCSCSLATRVLLRDELYFLIASEKQQLVGLETFVIACLQRGHRRSKLDIPMMLPMLVLLFVVGRASPAKVTIQISIKGTRADVLQSCKATLVPVTKTNQTVLHVVEQINKKAPDEKQATWLALCHYNNLTTWQQVCGRHAAVSLSHNAGPTVLSTAGAHMVGLLRHCQRKQPHEAALPGKYNQLATVHHAHQHRGQGVWW